MTEDDWEQLADQLRDHGVPRQLANVVALYAQGKSYGEIAAELGFRSDNDDRSQVSRHVALYRDQRDNAEWLAENAPEI